MRPSDSSLYQDHLGIMMYIIFVTCHLPRSMLMGQELNMQTKLAMDLKYNASQVSGRCDIE